MSRDDSTRPRTASTRAGAFAAARPLVEQCDDANAVNTDGCVSGCKTAICGDGFLQAGVEQCDDGNQVNDDGCTNTCLLPTMKNCKEILAGMLGSLSGLYMIDPDGNGGVAPFQTYCDMTTNGGGWTLILNRNVNSDNTGQPDINVANGVFNNARSTNWNFDVDLFWTDTTQWVFASKQNDNCSNCAITGYDSAIRTDKPTPTRAAACSRRSTCSSWSARPRTWPGSRSSAARASGGVSAPATATACSVCTRTTPIATVTGLQHVERAALPVRLLELQELR